MATARFIASDGSKGSDVELAAEVFDVQINGPVLHEVVRSQLAAGRSGTHSTKTRAEVRGGGAKPWMQKGTGRARHGSIREPSWVGGGIAHGPKPRDYSMRINKKEKVLALKSALTSRAKEGKVIVVEVPEFEEPETKRAIQLLEDWGATGKTLIVIAPDQEEEHGNVWKSFRNLPHVLAVTYPTAYTVLAAETVVFTKEALDALSSSTSTTKSSTTSTTKSSTKPSTKSARSEKTSPRPAAPESDASRGDDKPVAPAANETPENTASASGSVPPESSSDAEEGETPASPTVPLEGERAVEPPAGAEDKNAGNES